MRWVVGFVLLLALHAAAWAGDHVLEGVVRDVDGIPVPGATVRLGDLHRADDALEQTADELGRYRFEGLSGGLLELRVAPARQPVPQRAARVRVASLGRFDPVVMPGHAVSGRVFDVDTDEPLPGAQVTIRGDGYWGAFHGVATTGADGTYRLVTPGRGHRLHARADRDGWRMAGDEPWHVPSLSDDVAVMDVGLQRRPYGALRGVVRDPFGAPLVDVEVMVTNLRLSPTHERWITRTASDGSFLIENVDAGEVTVLARAVARYQEGEDGRFFANGGSDELPGPLHVRVPDGDAAEVDAAEVEVVLHLKVTAHGTVVDQYGIPVAGARVGVPANVAPLDFAMTTDDGAWELPVVPDSTVSLYASAPEHDAAMRRVDVPRDGVPENVEVVVQRHRSVTVHVRFPDGEPAVGARVGYGNPQYAGPYWGAGSMRVAANANGDVDIAVRPDSGVLVAFATAPGYAPGVTDEIPDNVDEVTVTLCEGHALRGRVLDADDRPLPGLRVTVQPGGSAWSGQPPDPHAFTNPVWAVTDDEGRFVVADLPVGHHGVMVSGADRWNEGISAQLPADDEIVLRPERAYAISGVVVDDAGEPVVGVRMSAYGARSDLIHPFTDERGRFRLTWLGEGLHRLTAEPPTNGHMEVRRDDVPASTTDELRIVVPRRHPVLGRVIVDEGEALPPSRVVLSRVTEERTARVEEFPTTAEGEFGFARQDPGDYIVSVLPDEGPWAPLHRLVRPAKDESMVLRLVQGERIGGVLLDGAGWPAADRVLVGRPLDLPDEAPPWMRDQKRTATTSATGTFVFEGLEAGRLMISLTPSANGAEDFLLADGGEIELRAGDDDVTLRGEWGASIEGLVVDTNGNGLEGARVWLRAGRDDREATTDTTGRFALRNLPEDALRFAPRVQLDGWVAVGSTPTRGSDGQPLLIQMAPSITVTGALVGEDGEALPGWSIEVRHDEHSWTNQVQTSKTGRFRINGAPEGVLICRARGPDNREWTPCGRFSTNVEDPLLRLGAE